MVRTYKYRLYPNKEQQMALQDILWVAGTLYNTALAYRNKRWQESRHRVTYYEQCAMWRDWRNEDPEHNPLRMLNMSAGQQALRRLDIAYREYLKGIGDKLRD
jgi:putative transposase